MRMLKIGLVVFLAGCQRQLPDYSGEIATLTGRVKTLELKLETTGRGAPSVHVAAVDAGTSVMMMDASLIPGVTSGRQSPLELAQYLGQRVRVEVGFTSTGKLPGGRVWAGSEFPLLHFHLLCIAPQEDRAAVESIVARKTTGEMTGVFRGILGGGFVSLDDCRVSVRPAAP